MKNVVSRPKPGLHAREGSESCLQAVRLGAENAGVLGVLFRLPEHNLTARAEFFVGTLSPHADVRFVFRTGKHYMLATSV